MVVFSHQSRNALQALRAEAEVTSSMIGDAVVSGCDIGEGTVHGTRESNTMKAKLRARVVIDVTGGNQILTTRTSNLRTNTTWNKQAR